MDRVQIGLEIGKIYTAMCRREETSDVLQARARQFFDDVVRPQGDEAQKRMLLHFISQFDPEGSVEPIKLGEGDVHTCKGTINQFSGEGSDSGKKVTSSACTSIAQCFLRRLLPQGSAHDFRPDEIDRIVRDGKKSFESIIKHVKVEGKLIDEAVSEALSHHDSADFYDLKTISSEGGKILDLKEDSTYEFFVKELETLEGLREEHGNVGGIIHAQGESIAVALLDQGAYWEYVLFDSHGSETLNGIDKAFVTITRNREEMAKILSTRLPYKKTERFVPGEDPIPEECAESMEKDNNPYILYVVKTKDNSLFGISRAASGEGAPAAAALSGESRSSNVGASSPPKPPVPAPANFEKEVKLAQVVTFALFVTMLSAAYAHRTSIRKFIVTHKPQQQPQSPLVR